MSRLIANRDILFDGKQYRAGEELPTYDTRMVELWKRGGSADFAEDTESSEAKAKARRKG